MRPIYFLIVFFITLQATAQSPWTKEKGRFFTNLSYSSISDYSELFGNPDFKISGTITDRTYQFYGEYGLTNSTSVLVNVPLKSIEINNYIDPAINCAGDCDQRFSETAFGNITLGVKHNFSKKKWVLSGQLNMEINTGTYYENSGIRTGYNAYTFTALFLAGTSFGKNYFQSFIGVDIRTNRYSSNFKIGGELGRKITRNMWLIGFIYSSQSLNNGDITFPVNNEANNLYVNDQEFIAYGLKSSVQFSKFGISASFASALSGNNVPKQAAISLGIFTTF